MKATFWSTKIPLIGWLKLKENDDVLAATVTGVKPGVKLTPPAVLTQVTPQVMSKVCTVGEEKRIAASTITSESISRLFLTRLMYIFTNHSQFFVPLPSYRPLKIN